PRGTARSSGARSRGEDTLATVPDRPTFEKSPPELVQRFDAVAARFPEAEQRKMFGYPALFIGGNLVTSLFGASWTIRLPDDARAELLALPGARDFEVMPGRRMSGYAVLPDDVVADDGRLDDWVRRAITHGLTLQRRGSRARRPFPEAGRSVE